MFTIGDVVGVEVDYETASGPAHGTITSATYSTSSEPVLMIDRACRPCEVLAPTLIMGWPAAVIIHEAAAHLPGAA